MVFCTVIRQRAVNNEDLPEDEEEELYEDAYEEFTEEEIHK